MDFNWKQYLANYPDLKNANIVTSEDAIKHYNNFGKNENRTDKLNVILNGNYGDTLLLCLVCDYISKVSNVKIEYPLSIPGLKLYQGQNVYTDTYVLDNSNVDSIFKDPSLLINKNILINGDLKTSFVAGYIQSFINKNKMYNPYIGGDYFVHVHFENDTLVDLEYYLKCLHKLPNSFGNYISSNNITHHICTTLIKKFNLTIVNLTDPVKIIQFGSKFKNIVLSKNTFSWFIGIFGNGNIYFPERLGEKNINNSLFKLNWNKINY